jgi:hypothetical protein
MPCGRTRIGRSSRFSPSSALSFASVRSGPARAAKLGLQRVFA